ncbi:MAG: ATP-binding protein [Bacteroidota bacterium]
MRLCFSIARKLPTAFFLFLSLFCTGQTPAEVDSIAIILGQELSEKEQALQLLELSNRNVFTDKAIALQAAQEALRLSKRTTNKALIADSYFQLEQSYFFQDNYEQALTYIDSALYLYTALDSQYRVAKMYDSKGNLLTFSGQHEAGYEALLKAMEGYQKLGKEKEEKGTKMLLAYLFDVLKEHDQARPLYEEAIEYFLDQNKPKQFYKELSFGIVYYALQHIEVGDYQEAITWLYRAKALADRMEDDYGQAIAISNIGWAHVKLEYPDSATYYCERGLEITEQFEDVFGISHNCKCLGAIEMLEGNYPEAERYLKRALIIADSISLLEEKMEIREYLYELYKEQGQLKRALRYFEEFKVLGDSVLTLDKARQLSLMQTQFDIVQKDNKNRELVQRLAAKSKESSYYVIVTLLILGLAISLASLYALQKKNNVKLEETVALRTQELKASNMRLTTANEELQEFSYITSHDLREPIRNISGFAGLAKRKLQENELHGVEDSLRYISKSAVQLNDLVNAVYNFVRLDHTDQQFETFPLDVLIEEIKEELAMLLLDKNGRITLFTNHLSITTSRSMLKIILKNLIGNALKYNSSEAAKVEIHILKNDQQYIFQIKDNGIGIDPDFREQVFKMFKRLHNRGDYSGSGLGLAICKKLVQRLGGRIEVSGSGLNDKGTQIDFSITPAS